MLPFSFEWIWDMGHIVFHGGLWYALSIIGIGLIVACFSKTVSQAFVIANFPLGFLMFLTGAAFPLPRFNLFTIAGRGIAIADFLPPTHAEIRSRRVGRASPPRCRTVQSQWRDRRR